MRFRFTLNHVSSCLMEGYPFEEWTNDSLVLNTPWNTGPIPTVTIPNGFQSKGLHRTGISGIPAGQHTLTYSITSTKQDFVTAEVRFLKAGVNISQQLPDLPGFDEILIPMVIGTASGTKQIVLSDIPDEVWIQVFDAGSVGSTTITLNRLDICGLAIEDPQEISEPDGWKGAKITLERDDQFFSLIERYEGAAGGAFIFYGDNGEENGGIEYIRDVEENYGFDANIEFLAEFAPDDVDYQEIFDGLLEVSGKNEMPDNKMQVPIIRDDFWAKFMSRMDTPVSLSDIVDLDGNPVDPVESITVNLPSQKIQKVFYGEFDEPVLFVIHFPNGYVQVSPDDIILDELEEFENLYTAFNPSVPVGFFTIEEGGFYDFDFRIVLSAHVGIDTSIGDVRDSFRQIASSWKVYFQKNEETPIEFTALNVDFPSPPSAGAGWTVYTHSGSNVELKPGDQIRVYGDEQSNLFTAMTVWTKQGAQYDPLNGDPAIYPNETGYAVPSYFRITGQTVIPATQAEGYLIHDLIHGVLVRYGLGSNPFYSEFLGSQLTNTKQYDEDGCGWMYVILKGLQIRQYTLTEKPFFISFKQIWDGINPILNLGLGYEIIDDSPDYQVIRIEQKAHFVEDDISVYFSNVRDISSTYDQNMIFKTVKTGYKKWQSENISGIDDPQTKHTYATRFEKVGKEINLESDFIAAGLAIETTRRTTREKSADYKYDNDNFIIALNQDDVSPDVYTPELDENFDSVSGLLNSDTRYNLILTPMRNLLRWANYLGGCLQSYTNSSYKFVSGEGNYDMVSDYSCSLGNQCQAIICDQLSESQDISLGLPGHYNVVFGYFFLPMIYDITIPMEWEEYQEIRNNRKKSIGISQTDSGHVAFKIKLLEYDLVKGEAIIKAWPKTFFRINVIDSTPEMECNVPGPVAFDEDYQAILDYADGEGYDLPSDDQQILQNQLVLDLKAAGVWTELDLLYIFATDGDSDFAKINWVDPGSFTATEVSSPTFTINQGFSNAGTSYLSTGWDATNNAVNFALNDAGVFAYCGTDITAANSFLFGSRDSGSIGRIELLPKRPVGGIDHLWGLNSTGTAARGTGVSSQGFFHIRRTATNDLRLFKDGVQVGTTESGTGTTGPNDDDIYLLATNSNGTPTGHILADIGIFGVGASLSGQESTLYTAWNNYFTSL